VQGATRCVLTSRARCKHRPIRASCSHREGRWLPTEICRRRDTGSIGSSNLQHKPMSLLFASIGKRLPKSDAIVNVNPLFARPAIVRAHVAPRRCILLFKLHGAITFGALHQTHSQGLRQSAKCRRRHFLSSRVRYGIRRSPLSAFPIPSRSATWQPRNCRREINAISCTIVFHM
jgi:hypothetical protein